MSHRIFGGKLHGGASGRPHPQPVPNDEYVTLKILPWYEQRRGGCCHGTKLIRRGTVPAGTSLKYVGSQNQQGRHDITFHFSSPTGPVYLIKTDLRHLQKVSR